MLQNSSYSFSITDVKGVVNQVFISYLIVFVISIGVPALFSSQHTIPIDVFTFNLFFILLHITLITFFINKIIYDDWPIFYRKLIIGCILFCLFYIIIEYIISYYFTPQSFPFWITGTDQFIYHKEGSNFCHALRGDKDWTFYQNYAFDDRGFFSWVGLSYYLCGEIHLPVKLLNALLLGITACFLSLAVYEQFENVYGAKLTGILYAFLPTMGFLSSILLKEITMMFFVGCWLICLIRTVKRRSIGYAILVCVSIFIMFTFRTFMGVLEIFLTLLYISSLNKKSLFMCLLSGIFFMIMYGSTILYGEGQISKGYNRLQRQSFYKKNKSIEHTQKVGGLTVLFPLSPIMPVPTTLDTHSSVDVSKFAPLYRIHQEIVRIVLTFFFYLGLLYIFANRRIIPMLLYVTGALIIMFIDTYLGTLTYYRYQATSLIFIVPIMAYGLMCFPHHLKRNTSLFFIYDIAIILFIIMFNIYRVDIS